MTKKERNELIIKKTKDGIKQEEIARELNCSVRTVRRVIEENLGSTTRNKNVQLDKIGHFIPEEAYEELLEKLEEVLDVIDIQNATIKTLQTEVASIKNLQVETASIEILKDSDYKYFLFDKKTGELLKKFVSEEECRKYLEKLVDIRIPLCYIEQSFKTQYEISFKGKYLLRNSLNRDFENIKFTTSSLKEDCKDIYKEIEEIKNSQI